MELFHPFVMRALHALQLDLADDGIDLRRQHHSEVQGHLDAEQGCVGPSNIVEDLLVSDELIDLRVERATHV